MAPLADAMRLVDGDQADTDAAQHLHGTAGGQPFRGEVEQLQRAGFERLPDRLGLFGGVARGQRAGRDAGLAQSAHLVAHQRDQRRDHHGHARAEQRRKLETERFAAAGGHDRQHVLAGRHGLDDLPLTGAESVESEHVPQ